MGGHERKSWNEFELRGFLARKGLWNVARVKILQDKCTLPQEEGDIVREYMATREEHFFSSWLREDVEGIGRKKERLRMLIVLERECLDLSEAIELCSEKQELLATLMESKKCLQKDAPERLQEQIFQELKELEERSQRGIEGIEPGFHWHPTVLPSVLAHSLWRVTWMKQCPRPPGGLPPWRRKEIGEALT